MSVRPTTDLTVTSHQSSGVLFGGDSKASSRSRGRNDLMVLAAAPPDIFAPPAVGCQGEECDPQETAASSYGGSMVPLLPTASDSLTYLSPATLPWDTSPADGVERAPRHGRRCQGDERGDRGGHEGDAVWSSCSAP